MGAGRSAVIGAVAFALALPLALAAHDEPQPPYPRAQAEDAALRDPAVARFLARYEPWDARVIALDREHWRVSFHDDARLLLEVSIDRGGAVAAAQEHGPGRPLPGSKIIWPPAVMILFSLAGAALLLRRPLRSIRNLDAVIVSGSFTLAALLWDARLPSAETYVAVAALAYVAVRCAAVAIAPRASASPLVVLSPALGRLLLVAAAVVAALVTVTSTGASDVALATLAGATALTDGTLPYGNLTPELVHGDTYPLLAYVVYVPAALIAPVRDAFDSLDGALWTNAIALLLAAALLARFGRHLALAFLVLPCVLLAGSSGANDPPAAAFAAGSLLAYGTPAAAAALLAIAGWIKLGPALALPIWLAGRGRLLRGLLAALGVSAVVLGLLLTGGTGELSAAWDAIRFQSERGSWHSLWQQAGITELQPVFQAAVVGFVAWAATQAWARHARGELDVGQAAGFAAAAIALVQIAANHWTHTYVAWLLPFTLVALFPPERLRSRQPEPRAP